MDSSTHWVPGHHAGDASRGFLNERGLERLKAAFVSHVKVVERLDGRADDVAMGPDLPFPEPQRGRSGLRVHVVVRSAGGVRRLPDGHLTALV